MRLGRTLATILLSSSIAGLAISSVQAGTLDISGVTPAFPGYGNTSGQNNVVNNGLPIMPVVDASATGANYKATGSVSTTLTSYDVTWYFVGAESGDTNQFTIGSLTSTEHNENSNCCSPGPNQAAQVIGTTSNTLAFKITDTNTGVNVTNGGPNPAPGTGIPSLVFAYLTDPTLVGGNLQWAVTAAQTSWFLFAFNDNGGDDNHDDYIGIGHIVATPLPGALALFAGGLGLMGVLGRRRKRKVATAELAAA